MLALTRRERPALTHVDIFSPLRALAGSFRWALGVARRCEQWEARGHRLDGEAIRRIVAEADRERALRQQGADA